MIQKSTRPALRLWLTSSADFCCSPTVCNVGSQNLFIFLNSCLFHTDKYLILYFYKLCTSSNVGNTSHSVDYFCHICHRRQYGIKWHFLINFWLLEINLWITLGLKVKKKKQRSLCFGDATTWVQLKMHTLDTLATNTPSRVSVQGVESLWGDYRFIPADWGS